MYTLMVEDTFSAAHQLMDYKGPCENLHGHTWKIQVFVCGEKLDKAGMLIDFKNLKSMIKKERDLLDHSFINEKVDFSPTSENLARYFFNKLQKKMPDKVKVSRVTIWESAVTCASYALDKK